MYMLHLGSREKEGLVPAPARAVIRQWGQVARHTQQTLPTHSTPPSTSPSPSLVPNPTLHQAWPAATWVNEEGSWQGTCTVGIRAPHTFAFVHGTRDDAPEQEKHVTAMHVARIQEMGAIVLRATQNVQDISLQAYTRQHGQHRGSGTMTPAQMNEQESARLHNVIVTPHVMGVLSTFRLMSWRIPVHIAQALSFRVASFTTATSDDVHARAGVVPPRTSKAHSGEPCASTPYTLYCSVTYAPGDEALRSVDTKHILNTQPSAMRELTCQLVHTVLALESRFPGWYHMNWEQACSWYRCDAPSARVYVFGDPHTNEWFTMANCAFVRKHLHGQMLRSQHNKVAATQSFQPCSLFAWMHSIEGLCFPSTFTPSAHSTGSEMIAACCLLRMVVLAYLRAGFEPLPGVVRQSHMSRERMLRRCVNCGWEEVLRWVRVPQATTPPSVAQKQHEESVRRWGGVVRFSTPQSMHDLLHLVTTVQAWERRWCEPPPTRSTASTASTASTLSSVGDESKVQPDTGGDVRGDASTLTRVFHNGDRLWMPMQLKTFSSSSPVQPAPPVAKHVRTELVRFLSQYAQHTPGPRLNVVQYGSREEALLGAATAASSQAAFICDSTVGRYRGTSLEMREA